MKASSVGVEYSVKLNEEEIETLGRIGLRGEIRIRNREKIVGDFPLDLRVGKIDLNQLYVEVRIVPQNVYVRNSQHFRISEHPKIPNKTQRFFDFEDACRFRFVLSKEGYKTLKEKGFTGDRMYNNPGCKVDICSEKYLRY